MAHNYESFSSGAQPSASPANELLPCPFCGSDVDLVEYSSFSPSNAVCRTCNLSIPIATWNSRFSSGVQTQASGETSTNEKGYPQWIDSAWGMPASEAVRNGVREAYYQGKRLGPGNSSPFSLGTVADRAYKEGQKDSRPLAADELKTLDIPAMLKEAQAIVESKYVYKKFIEGTPLANDIAVWMAEFAYSVADFARANDPVVKQMRDALELALDEIYFSKRSCGELHCGMCDCCISLDDKHNSGCHHPKIEAAFLAADALTAAKEEK